MDKSLQPIPDSNPFLSCDSVSDIVRDYEKHFLQFGNKKAADLLKFAQKVENYPTMRVVRPPILEKLPECIKLETFVVHKKEVIDHDASMTPVAGIDPVPDFETLANHFPCGEIGRLIKEPALKDNFIREFIGHATTPEFFGMEFYHQIKRQIYLFMKNGRTSLPFDRVKLATALYAVLLPANDDIYLAISSSTSENDPLFQNAIAELLFARMRDFVKTVSYLDLHQLRRSLKQKLGKITLPFSARAAIICELNGAASGEEYKAFVQQRLPVLLARRGITPSERKKASGIFESATVDLSRIAHLYRKWFIPDSLEPFQRVYKSMKIGAVIRNYHAYQIHERERTLSLRLYPSKDLLELIKGHISGDCTSNANIAINHLLTKEFFNFRVVSGSEWIGNIYCLDFSKDHNCCILDRIQVPVKVVSRSAGFFPALAREFAAAFGDIKLLAPLVLSNSDTVCKAFTTYLRTQDNPRYEENDFPWRQRLRAFESVAMNDTLFVFPGRPR